MVLLLPLPSSVGLKRPASMERAATASIHFAGFSGLNKLPPVDMSLFPHLFVPLLSALLNNQKRRCLKIAKLQNIILSFSPILNPSLPRGSDFKTLKWKDVFHFDLLNPCPHRDHAISFQNSKHASMFCCCPLEGGTRKQSNHTRETLLTKLISTPQWAPPAHAASHVY